MIRENRDGTLEMLDTPVIPPQRPAPEPSAPWTDAVIAACDALREDKAQVKIAEQAVTDYDQNIATHRQKLAETRDRIRQIESAATVPTMETALELLKLKTFAELMSNFLAGTDATRQRLLNEFWGTVNKLARRLYTLTNRDHWPFAERNDRCYQNIHALAAKEIERLLRGEMDSFDIMNATPSIFPNLMTSNTISNQSFK